MHTRTGAMEILCTYRDMHVCVAVRSMGTWTVQLCYSCLCLIPAYARDGFELLHHVVCQQPGSSEWCHARRKLLKVRPSGEGRTQDPCWVFWVSSVFNLFLVVIAKEDLFPSLFLGRILASLANWGKGLGQWSQPSLSQGRSGCLAGTPTQGEEVLPCARTPLPAAVGRGLGAGTVIKP